MRAWTSSSSRRKTKNGVFVVANESQARAVGREFAQRVFLNPLPWKMVYEAPGKDNNGDHLHPFVLYDLVDDKPKPHYSVRLVTQARGKLPFMQQLLAAPLPRQQMLSNLLQDTIAKGLLLADFGTKIHDTGEHENVDVQLMQVAMAVGDVGPGAAGFDTHVMLGYTLETSLERYSEMHHGIKTFPSVIHLMRRVEFTKSPLGENDSSNHQDFALTFIVQETESPGVLRIEVLCSTDCVTNESKHFLQVVVQRLAAIEQELRLFECLQSRYASGQVGNSLSMPIPVRESVIGDAATVSRRSQNMSELSLSTDSSLLDARRSANRSLVEDGASNGTSNCNDDHANHQRQRRHGDRARARTSNRTHLKTKCVACAVCAKSFNAFRWKYSCGSCHQMVCNRCYSVIANPTARTRKRKICNVCLYDRTNMTAAMRRTTRGDSTASDNRASGTMQQAQAQSQVAQEQMERKSIDSYCNDKASGNGPLLNARVCSPSAAPALRIQEPPLQQLYTEETESMQVPLSCQHSQNSSPQDSPLEQPRGSSRSNSNAGPSRLTVGSTRSSRDSVLLDDEILRSLDESGAGISRSRRTSVNSTNESQPKSASIENNVVGDCQVDYELDFDWFNIFPKAPIPVDESKRLEHLADMGLLDDEASCLHVGSHFDIENCMQQLLRLGFVTPKKPAFNHCRVTIVGQNQTVCIKKLVLLGNGEIVEELTSLKVAHTTPRLESASSYAVYYNEPFIVHDLTKDERLCAHPLCVDEDAVVLFSVPLYSSTSKQPFAKCIGTVDFYQTSNFVSSQNGLTLCPVDEMLQFLTSDQSVLESIQQVAMQLGVSIENIARQNVTKRLFRSPIKSKTSVGRPAATSTSSCSSIGSGSTRRDDSFELSDFDFEYDPGTGSPIDPVGSHGCQGNGRAGGPRLSSVQQLESLLNQINETSDMLRRTTLGGCATGIFESK